MCTQVIYLKTKEVKTTRNAFTTPVPCGNCPECARARVNSWLFRLQQEMKITSNPLFITLTYNEQNVPHTEKGLKTLYKKDIQDWLKRLRKQYAKTSDKQIRYYAVGEYGTRTQRPHYHIIMLNMDRPELIGKTWNMGIDKTLPLLDGGVTYVLKYLHKQRKKKEDWDDRNPEFSLMSKKLGLNFVTQSRIRFHNQGVEFAYIRSESGHKMSMPKYYKEKIYSEEMRYQVTHYLQVRSEEILEEKIDRIYLEDQKRSKESIRKDLEYQKIHSRFDKRKEVL